MKSATIEPISAVIPEVSAHGGKVITTSLAVASYFHKRHDHVLEKIRTVIADCDPSWRLPNFRVCHENNELQNGKPQPYYELTRDAFVLIVMGFTGKKALQWKIDYINAFNKMEAELQQHHTTLFPLDADLFVQIRNGKTTLIQQARSGQMFASVKDFKEMLERGGYLVVHSDDLRVMTLDGIMKLGAQAAQTAQLCDKKRSAL